MMDSPSRKRGRAPSADDDLLSAALARAEAAEAHVAAVEAKIADALARLTAAESRLAAATSTSDALSARVAVMDANFVHTRPDLFLAHITTLLAYNGYGAEAAQCIRLCKDAVLNVDLLARVVDIPRGVQRSAGKTLLMHRAWQGEVEGIALLLSLGAAVDAVSVKGDTALVWAARGGHVAACAALLKAGARATGYQFPSNEYWRTSDSPLVVAARFNHADVVSLLLSAGVPPTVAAVNAGGKEGVLAALLRAGLSSPAIAAAVCTAVYNNLTSRAISDGVPCGADLLTTAIKAHRGDSSTVRTIVYSLMVSLERPDAAMLIPWLARSKFVAELPLVASTSDVGYLLLRVWDALAKLPGGLFLFQPNAVGGIVTALSASSQYEGYATMGCQLLLTLTTPTPSWHRSSDFAAAIVTCGGVEAIATGLKLHRRRETMTERGFNALISLVKCHPWSDATAARVAGAVSVLLAGLDDTSTRIYHVFRHAGIVTLTACCETPSSTSLLIAAGGLHAALNPVGFKSYFRAHDYLSAATLKLVGAAARHVGAAVLLGLPTTATDLVADVVDIMGNVGVYTAAAGCWFLGSLLRDTRPGGSTRREIILAAGGLRAITAEMLQHDGSLQVSNYGCEALALYAEGGPECASAVVAAGGGGRHSIGTEDVWNDRQCGAECPRPAAATLCSSTSAATPFFAADSLREPRR